MTLSTRIRLIATRHPDAADAAKLYAIAREIEQIERLQAAVEHAAGTGLSLTERAR